MHYNFCFFGLFKIVTVSSLQLWKGGGGGGGDEESNVPLLNSDSVDEEQQSQNSKLADLNVDEEKKEKAPEDPFHRTVKLIFCFLGLQVSYVLWGVAQEQIMTHEYKPGRV